MRLGYNTNGFAHHRLEDALVILAELGYQSVALTLDYLALNPFDPAMPGQLGRVKALLREHDLHSVIETGARFLLEPRRKHQPTLLGSEAEAGKRLDFLKTAVDIAQELGSDAVSFWSGAPPGISGDHALRHSLVRGCKLLCHYADARGVRLAFEPEPGMYIDTMERFAWLYQQVAHPSFGLTLDLGHLHCQGEVPIGEHLQRWRDWLWNVHIEDMRRGVHDHLMFGEGEMDFTAILADLVKIGYEGGVHVELSRHSHNAVETARKSLEFLRKRS